jgi:Ser/Thr protein kinase RdoA (MazF antagonist)
VTSVHIEGVDRYAVLFHEVPGVEPDEAGLKVDDFQTLGVITAHMHLHSRSWSRPESFTRFAWDWEHSLGGQPRWGRWQDGFGVGATELEVFGRAAELIRRRLEAYGTALDRFGLVHADLRLANLLVDNGNVTVIDFDDSGFSWFMYDFGAAVSFIEHDPRLAEWRDAWLQGYRSVAPLEPEHEAMLPTFVMLRRLLLIAWMGSHSHSRECQTLGPTYTKDSVALAHRYIASDGAAI